MWNLLVRCLKDETGNEAVEFALVLGMVAVCAIALMGRLGLKVLGMWQQLADVL